MSHTTCPGEFRAPAGTEEHGLLVIHSPLLRLLGEFSPLSRGELLVGRDAGCDFVLDVPDVSRRHARIHQRSDSRIVEDLGSTNGTFVDDQRITTAELVPGSLLRVGSVVLKYLAGNDLEALCCAKMKRLADKDTLTGLALRRVFADALARELARSRRHGHPLCLALLDIDHFKDVNDRFGHLVGDAVLLQVSSAIGALVRREQLLARMGGDELALLLPDVPLSKAGAFAEKIRRIIEGQVFGTEESSISITMSIGVAELRPNDAKPDALVARADTQLYAAKCAGRNRVYPRVASARGSVPTLRGVAAGRSCSGSPSEASSEARTRAVEIDHGA